jgi:hypothetical protein
METIAMLNGLGASPRNMRAYAAQTAAQTVASQAYNARLAGLAAAPMTREQAILAAQANTIVDSRYSRTLAGTPMPAKDFAVSASRSIASGQWLNGAPTTAAAVGRRVGRRTIASGQWSPLAGLGASATDVAAANVAAQAGAAGGSFMLLVGFVVVGAITAKLLGAKA